MDTIAAISHTLAGAPDVEVPKAVRKAINSALHANKRATLGKAKTVAEIRAHLGMREAEPVTQVATPAQVEAQGWEPSKARAPKARKVLCNGVNLSASSANEHCGRKVRLSAGERPTEALCHQHEDQRGRDYSALVIERTRNIWQAEDDRKAYLARKEALAMLADLNA